MAHKQITQVYTAGSGVVALAGNATLLFSMQTEAENDIVLLSMGIQSTAEAIEITLYEAVTSNVGGIVGVPVNRDRQSTRVFPAEFKHTVTSRVGGTPIVQSALLGTKSKDGVLAQSGDLTDLRLKASTLYNLQITNLDAAAKQIVINWEIGAAQKLIGATN